MLLYVVLAIFATWRLTYDLLNLDGPFNLYIWVRNRIENSNAPDWIKEGITCYHCLSFWVGFAVALLIPDITMYTYPLYAIGISGAVTLIARYMTAMYNANLFD